jgi:hypothetical protein
MFVSLRRRQEELNNHTKEMLGSIIVGQKNLEQEKRAFEEEKGKFEEERQEFEDQKVAWEVEHPNESEPPM